MLQSGPELSSILRAMCRSVGIFCIKNYVHNQGVKRNNVKASLEKLNFSLTLKMASLSKLIGFSN
jgi:hypothetical protein